MQYDWLSQQQPNFLLFNLFCYNNNNNNNNQDNVYDSVIMTQSFREFTRFM